ncbi:MAG: HD domain-containing protein [Planctomycetia bacterium]|nr:HD domain-containing protein [Planctomycetia bacterium]
MARLFVNQLNENQNVTEVYRLVDKSTRPNKHGVLYMQFTLNDRTGSIGARYWNVTEDFANLFSDGDYVLCDGMTQRFQGNLQLIARTLKRVDPTTVNPEDFLLNTSVDRESLLNRLRELLQEVKNPSLVELVRAFLNDDALMTRFTRAYAGVRLHHAYPGGLMEHTVAIMEHALFVANYYPTMINRDILLVGAFLHDVGKIYEMSDDPLTPIYTNAGQALGHPYLGVEILTKKIAELEAQTHEVFDPQLATLLKHMILTHHGEYQNGAAKLPSSLEALALYYLDSLDAKLNEFKRYQWEDPHTTAPWTNYIANIERKLIRTDAFLNDKSDA